MTISISGGTIGNGSSHLVDVLLESIMLRVEDQVFLQSKCSFGRLLHCNQRCHFVFAVALCGAVEV